MKLLSVNAGFVGRAIYSRYLVINFFMVFIFAGVLSIREVNASNFESFPTDSVFQVVDRQPVFRGKPSDVQRFIRNKMVYPHDSWLNGIEGVVQVSFVVTNQGQVLNTSIEQSVNAELDLEALRLVDMLDSWQPGKRDGIPVHTLVSIPVKFSLSPDEKQFIGTLQQHGLSENLPMYVIDDKIVNTRIHLPSYNLESIRVMKGEKAVERYGEGARNGVVVITTKRGTPPVR